ncbi:M17 family metallopeptidase [Planktotalea sp.]|uniref:leucyl aminopeptidase family protein n=1 Tax=Planktotalea sp. TaxID=2029877 RepID=UPI0025D1042E|nr:leucyl aminopeptidase family protein [Planktotalea sp.]
MSLTFALQTAPSIPLTLLSCDDLGPWLSKQSERLQNWVNASGFTGAFGTSLVLPNETGGIEGALVGFGTASARVRTRFALGAARASLPAQTFHLVDELDDDVLKCELLGWLLSGYTFDRYREQKAPQAQLKCPENADARTLEAIVAGEVLTRNLINTPASDMGPPDLENAARDLAMAHGAEIKVVEGQALLDQNFPMIHAVGRAASRAPRLIDLHWGKAGPTLTLVGKGVCFDTGGLNIKPGGSMGLMKKDMGGAAAVLGLAKMIMSQGLPIRLRVLVPAVENSISADAFRPQDILNSRKGLTVEINNTDAEGRLVLADALAFADEETPDLIISMATLTGAARVAVGPDLAPYFAQSDASAQALEAAAKTVQDPVWRMPFWDPYEGMIEPGIADLDNAPKGGFAGCITAALFLRRFVTETPNYMHFDIYGWQPSAAPARPKGGAGQAARALFEALPKLLNL